MAALLGDSSAPLSLVVDAERLLFGASISKQTLPRMSGLGRKWTLVRIHPLSHAQRLLTAITGHSAHEKTNV